jgi:predicted DNA-binding transcriptional regulator AlpA
MTNRKPDSIGLFMFNNEEIIMSPEDNNKLLQIREDRLLRLRQVLELIPVSKSAWWAGVASGRYPASVKLTEKTTCWRLSDIMALIDQAGV